VLILCFLYVPSGLRMALCGRNMQPLCITSFTPYYRKESCDLTVINKAYIVNLYCYLILLPYIVNLYCYLILLPYIVTLYCYLILLPYIVTLHNRMDSTKKIFELVRIHRRNIRHPELNTRQQKHCKKFYLLKLPKV
jgi:hypothetical protein